jgi:hypothetical protein
MALEWSRFCAGIEDDECNAHYVRILEAVIGALVWDVRGFGDNGQRLERDKVSGFKKLLPGSWRTHRYFCCLHHWVSTASFASFHLHLHLTSTHRRLCCLLHLVEFFELNGRVHTHENESQGLLFIFIPDLGVATFINQFRLLKVLCVTLRVEFGFLNRTRLLNVHFFC